MYMAMARVRWVSLPYQTEWRPGWTKAAGAAQQAMLAIHAHELELSQALLEALRAKKILGVVRVDLRDALGVTQHGDL